MDLGLLLPQGAHNNLQRDVTKVARQAEQAGFDSLWAYERVLFPLEPADGLYGVDGLPWIDYYQYCADPLTVLTLAGAVTERIRLGTSVLIAPLHNKLLLARALSTLDQATGGRVTAGLGGGWSSDEFAAAGADFGQRGQALDEMIAALRALTSPNPVTYADSQISVHRGLVTPKPATPIPLLLGGGYGPRSIRRIAEKSDGWMPSNQSGAEMAGTWKRILDLAASAGRDPGDLRLVPLATQAVVADQPLAAGRPQFHGSPDQLTEDFAEIAAAGAHELIIELDSGVTDAGQLIEHALTLLDAADRAGLHGPVPAA